MVTQDVMARLIEAQSRNAGLSGQDLAKAADKVARLARRNHALLVAHDSAGDRIIGAALVLRPEDCRPADVTARFEGQSLIVVSGMIAAPHALVQDITQLRSMGAGHIHVAVIGGWTEVVPGASTVTAIGEAVPSASSAA